MRSFFGLLVLLSFLGCDEDEQQQAQLPPEPALYFPPSDSDEWETTDASMLNWNIAELSSLIDFLDSSNTRAFIILKDGRIVVEEYFGSNTLGTAPFDKDSRWYWASAGKTLTAALAGIAQQEGVLDIEAPVSNYLGTGWTSLSSDKEQLIRVRDQLSMTSGLEYLVTNNNCTLPSCLTYRTDAGQQWFYHNAPYLLIKDVIESASGISYGNYTDQKIGSVIGLSGQWIQQGYHHVYWSTARDMARFGLLMLNQGAWAQTEVLSDKAYFDQMTHPSQNLNPSYGYLWWLNGQSSFIPPGLSLSIDAPLSEHAPDDLYAGLGLNGQFVEVIPSQQLVVIRMGEAPDSSPISMTFHNSLWERIKRVIGS